MKNFIRNMKNQTFDPIEVKVRDATSSDPWGAPSTLMGDIAEATQDYAQYPKLFQMLWKRLRDYQIHMHVQKALLLVDYLLRNGSDRFVRDAQHRADDVAKLKRYKYYNKNNEDIATDIRKKAKAVHDLLMNDAALAQEREKAVSLRGVRSSHVSNREDPSPREPDRVERPAERPPRPRKEPGDAYDNYSDVSKQEAFEAAVREETARRMKAEEAARRKKNQVASQDDEEQPQTDEPEEAPAPRPKTRPAAAPRVPSVQQAAQQPAARPKPRPKPAPQPVEEPAEEEEEQPHASPPRLQQPPARAKSSKARVPPQQTQQQADPFENAFDQNFAVPQDPFNPVSNQQPKKKNNVDALLADALGGGNQAYPQSYPRQQQQQPAASGVDFLTGAVEQNLVFDDDAGQYDDGQQGDGGQVVWEPESDQPEEEQQQHQPQQQARGGNDVWDNLINLDNVTVEKKQAAPVKKQGRPMSEMAAKKGSVIMGTAIDGFEAPAQNPSASPAYGFSQPPPAYGAYPNGPGFGYPPQMGAPNPMGGMGMGPMGGMGSMGMGSMGGMGAPMGMGGAVSPAGPGGFQKNPGPQPRRSQNAPQPAASNPFNW